MQGLSWSQSQSQRHCLAFPARVTSTPHEPYSRSSRSKRREPEPQPQPELELEPEPQPEPQPEDVHGGRSGTHWTRLNFPTEKEADRAKALGMPAAR